MEIRNSKLEIRNWLLVIGKRWKEKLEIRNWKLGKRDEKRNWKLEIGNWEKEMKREIGNLGEQHKSMKAEFLISNFYADTVTDADTFLDCRMKWGIFYDVQENREISWWSPVGD